MASAVPVVCLTALIVLAMVARDRRYEMTSVSLIGLAGAVAIYYGTLFWMFG